MPQPLSSYSEEAWKNFEITGHDDLPSRHNPELAGLAMDAIGSNSRVEAFLLEMHLTMLWAKPGTTLRRTVDTGNSAAAAVFLSMESGAAKAAAINAVAKKALLDDHKELLAPLLKNVRSAAKKRNKLAHGLWGYSEKIPDGLLLISPKDMYGSGYFGIDIDTVFVYKKAELVSMVADNGKLCRTLSLFTEVIAGRDNESRDKNRALCDLLGVQSTPSRDPP